MMYMVTWKNRPITVRNIFMIEDQKPKYHTEGVDSYIMSTVRHECIRKFYTLFGYGWNRRNRNITMHKVDIYGRLLEDVTDTGDWQQRRRDKAEAKRIAAKVRKSRLY